MKIYHYDSDFNYYLGASDADESPLEPGVFLIPAHATVVAPPTYDIATERVFFADGTWVNEAIPVEPPVTEDPILPPTEAEVIAWYTNAVQLMLDTKAKERNYDGILSICTYVTSTIAKFRNEAQACVEWRDTVWMACYTYMANVKAGTQAQLGLDDFLATLPTLTWPA